MVKQDEEGTLDELISELSKEIGGDSGINAAALEGMTKHQEEELNRKYKLSSFPSEMNCASAFDQLIECYSLGGQLRHVYRYGEMSNCREQRSRAKFCVFNKLNSKDVQKEKVAKYYMEKLARQKLEKGSSEDVWTARSERVDHPFQEEQ